MHCPQCKGYTLEPKLLEKDLLAASCKKCDGAILSLLNYRYWSEHHCEVKDVTNVASFDIEAEETRDVKLCPKCGRMMTKYRIGMESDNRIDHCSGCDEVWLDKGEWRLLKQLELHDQLPNIFTDEWQRNIRQQGQKALVKAKYSKTLGERDFSKVDQFKCWLEDHPQREHIKQYLIISFD